MKRDGDRTRQAKNRKEMQNAEWHRKSVGKTNRRSANKLIGNEGKEKKTK